MKAIVKQDFDYSHDGLTLVRLRAGEIHEISDKAALGLVDARLIAKFVPQDPEIALASVPAAPVVQAPSAAVVAPVADTRAAAPPHRSRFDNKRR